MKIDSPPPIWLTQGAAKVQAVNQMFSEIAPVYDRMNRIMSMGLDHRWRKAAIEAAYIQSKDHVLDLCTGTGDFIPHIFKKLGPEGNIVAVDLCASMLERAVEKYSKQASFKQANACTLPFQNESFDVVTVGWGIRNVPDIDLAHKEVYRVLKPGGRFVSIDMAEPENIFLLGLSRLLFFYWVPFLWKLVGLKYAGQYLPESTALFYSRKQLEYSMNQAGFDEIGYKNLFFGNLCIHWGIKP